ncbi:GNAT family N-acetyltransferase [Nocardioides aurantiacus]|uniref:GNAT family N-acetyltransferase n=1 Tax=Nocardioides aurantiacus TaxID=86796 RepID=UPI00403F36D9
MTDAICETERLVVRPWRHEEAPRLLDILSRVEVVKWLDDGPPRLMADLDAAHAQIDRAAARSASPPLGSWAVVPRATGVPVGSVLTLELPDAASGEVEIGWHLHPDSWGQGYAREAAAAVLARALDHGLEEVFALTHVPNLPSRAVARAIGMRDLGVHTWWYAEPSQVFRADRTTHPRP